MPVNRRKAYNALILCRTIRSTSPDCQTPTKKRYCSKMMRCIDFFSEVSDNTDSIKSLLTCGLLAQTVLAMSSTDADVIRHYKQLTWRTVHCACVSAHWPEVCTMWMAVCRNRPFGLLLLTPAENSKRRFNGIWWMLDNISTALEQLGGLGNCKLRP